MQLHFDGSTSLTASRSSIYGLLTDTNFIGKNLTDAEDIRVIDDTHLEAKLRVRIAIVSSTLRVKMAVTNKKPQSEATLVAEGSGSGSTVKIVSTFTLLGDEPTVLSWAADAEITGVMAGIGQTLLKGFATKKVTEIFGGITKAIEDYSKEQTSAAPASAGNVADQPIREQGPV